MHHPISIFILIGIRKHSGKNSEVLTRVNTVTSWNSKNKSVTSSYNDLCIN